MQANLPGGKLPNKHEPTHTRQGSNGRHQDNAVLSLIIMKLRAEL